MRPFRFGLAKTRAASAAEYRATARRAEGSGYDVMLCADHLGALSPTVALATAAAVTERLRLGALVLNNDFRHPALVAQEAATLDVMSDGRYELGIGAGWNAIEYTESGIGFDRAGVRIDRMEESIRILKGLFAGETVTMRGRYYTITEHRLWPRPPQGANLPLLVGGNGSKVLGVAARHADIVGLTGFSMTPNGPSLSHLNAAGIAERIAYIHQRAGGRGEELELNALVQAVDVTRDRRARARRLAAEMSDGALEPIDASVVLDSPFALLGTPAQLIEQLRHLRARTGIASFTVRADGTEAFDPVVAELAGT